MGKSPILRLCRMWVLCVAVLGFVVAAIFISSSANVEAQALDTRFGQLAMDGEQPAKGSVANLFDERDFQQATQTISG